jgi:YesN/AraC family two-component response regulator
MATGPGAALLIMAIFDRGEHPMGFFDALKRVLSHGTHEQATDETKKRIREAWGLGDEEGSAEVAPEHAAASAGEPATNAASAYDRSQWQKKLRHILEELPDSQKDWQELMAEAHALELEPDWIAKQQHEEFAFLIRRAVSDRVVSEDDHHKLDLARKLIGISETEAEQTLHAIVAEAEAFFGTQVKDEV